jgi:hypothetical protein
MSSNRYEKTREEKIDQKKAAAKAIEYIKNLEPRMHRTLGLRSKEAKQGTPGEPLNVFMITLDGLDRFRAGDDPGQILLDTKKIIIPVYRGRNLISSVTMDGRRGEWELSAIGGDEINWIEPARSKHSRAKKRDLDSYMVIGIHGMYLRFLGYYQDNRLHLIAIHPHPDFDFQLHTEIPAEKVLLELKSSVNKYRRILDPQKR